MLLSVQVLFCLFALSSASLSGLYVDNGIDQTVIQRILSKQEKRDIEQEILNLLGLPDRPRVKRFVKPEYLDHSGSKYLLDVYKSLLDMPSRTTRSEININEKDLNAIEESDAIVSFRSHSRDLLLLNYKKGSLMWFDISEISQEASVLNAELRVYHTGNSTHSSDLTAAVYKLSDSENGALDLVTSFNLTNEQGWLNFNVTDVFGSWVVQPYTNEGLYISVKLPSGEELSCEEAGLAVDSVGGENQPYLVAFLRGSGEVGSRGTTRAPRVRRVARRSRKNTPYHNNPLTEWSQQQRSCQIQTLYVSFRDLNWQDWIIAPDGYGAFYCSGECNFPLNAHMNATNHAIVQTLVHLMNPIQVPKPCCAPTRLTPISVLYYLEDSNVILKKYKNMVVKSCGCH